MDYLGVELTKVQNAKNKKVHFFTGEQTLCGMTGAEIPGFAKAEFVPTTLPVDCKLCLRKKPTATP